MPAKKSAAKSAAKASAADRDRAVRARDAEDVGRPAEVRTSPVVEATAANKRERLDAARLCTRCQTRRRYGTAELCRDCIIDEAAGDDLRAAQERPES